MKYLYRSHMGGFYITDELQNGDDLWCDACGDWDYLVGEAADASELWALMMPELSIFGSGGVSLRHAYEMLTGHEPMMVGPEDPTDLDVLAQIASYLTSQ